MKYKIYLSGVAYVGQEVEVEANNLEEAKEIAVDNADESGWIFENIVESGTHIDGDNYPIVAYEAE